MEIIDEEGNLFGVINVVDALAALLVLAVVVAGVALMVPSDERPEASESVTVTATVKLADVSPEFADDIETGLTERQNGDVTARVVEKEEVPAVVVVTSDDGHIYAREHPRNKDIYLGVELRATNADEGLRFHDAPLQVGREVTLDLGIITVSGRIVELERWQ